MKVSTIVSIAVIACLVVCGCSSNKQSAGTGKASSAKKLRFVLCPKNLNNAFWIAVGQGMKDKAKELGVEAEFVAPVEADAAKQVAMIEDVIARGASGIAISPNDPDSVVGVIGQAKSRDIPIITFDSDSPKSERTCYVGTDNTPQARKQAKPWTGLPSLPALS
jgi:ribose transport system substrate-binding protein